MSMFNQNNRNLQSWPIIPPNTTDIRLDNNQIHEIPDNVGELNGLQRIIINNNKITKISDSLKNLPNFIDLRLNNNNLSKIIEPIYNLNKLQILLLSNNAINKIEPEINKLKSLAQLHLQNNLLETLPSEIDQLSNLTHLLLDNNPIEYLPPSIKNLKKLQNLSLSGTKLPLPASYNPTQNIQATIDYILENQKEPPPTALFIKNAFVFKNLSKSTIVNRFNTLFDEFSKQYDVSFSEISNLEDINKNTTSVLIIVGFDIHENQNLIFNIIKKCSKLSIPYKILYQKDIIFGIGDINLEKGPETEKIRLQLEQNHQDKLLAFDSMDELKGLVLNILKSHKPEVIINSLHLTNIGHFENAIINFDKQLTCIVGENGQGKSSILRSLALAVIGSDQKISKHSLENLLRIKSITQDGKIKYCDSGSITLNYTIDSDMYQNEITLNSKDEGRLIEVLFSGDLQLNAGDYNLKSLIVGFPQLRGRINPDNKMIKSPYSQPHIDDLIPLLGHDDDVRLDSFVAWIANLYGDAIKEGNYKESAEYLTIEYVFEIISELTGKPISFMTVQQFSPPIVIISSPDSPNGIPLNLISQGFKIVIGWIGYFIQRRIEAFPLSSPSVSASEKSILIIDEIDSSIHPVWQSRLLTVLRAKFPSTQIICTTHSPLMLAGLNRDQIQEIQKTSEDKLEVHPNDFDTWASSYQEILQMIFNTSDFIPTVTKEELTSKLSVTQSSDEIQAIKETIDRLESNEILDDDIKNYKKNLAQKEKELEKLIEEYKNKNK